VAIGGTGKHTAPICRSVVSGAFTRRDQRERSGVHERRVAHGGKASPWWCAPRGAEDYKEIIPAIGVPPFADPQDGVLHGKEECAWSGPGRTRMRPERDRERKLVPAAIAGSGGASTNVPRMCVGSSHPAAGGEPHGDLPLKGDVAQVNCSAEKRGPSRQQGNGLEADVQVLSYVQGWYRRYLDEFEKRTWARLG
jgi:hypothetical protein